MTTINQLPPATNPQPTDLIPVQTADGTTAAYTPANVAAAMGIGRAAYLPAGGANGAVVADVFGNLSPQAFVSQGTTAARTFAVRGADSVNVADFGAKLNGTAVDSAAFQAAYNAAPNNGVIDIPNGSGFYAGYTSVAGKSVLWRLLGTLDYGNAPAGTSPVIYIGDGDVLEHFLGGAKRFAKQITSNYNEDYATVRVDLDVTDGPGNPNGVNTALVVNGTQGANGPNPGVFVINGVVNVNGTAPDNIGVSASAIINVSKAGGTIALYSQVLDNYGDGSLTACEFDIYTCTADPIVGGISPINGHRAVVLAQCGIQSGSTAECSRGIQVGTKGGASLGSAVYAYGNVYSAFLDSADAVFLTHDASGNEVSVAGLRLGPNQPIDFCGVYATSQLNHRTLQWNEGSGNLEYQVGGTAVFSIEDNGALALPAGAAITVGGNQLATVNKLGAMAGILALGTTSTNPNPNIIPDSAVNFWIQLNGGIQNNTTLPVNSSVGDIVFIKNDSAIPQYISSISTQFIWTAGAEGKTRQILLGHGATIKFFSRGTNSSEGEWDVIDGSWVADFSGTTYTVETLPPSSVNAKVFVSDALNPKFLNPVIGGGSVTCPAFFNGTTWIVG